MFFLSFAGKEKTVQSNTQVNEHTIKKVEFQVKQQQETVQTNKMDSALIKKEAAAAAAAAVAAGQTDSQKNMPVKTNTHLITPAQSIPDSRPDTRQTSQELISQSNREARAGGLKQQEGKVDMNVNKQDKGKVKATDHISQESTKLPAGAKDKQNGMMNGAMKCEESALMSSHKVAGISKQQSVPTAEGKANGGSQVQAVRSSMAPLPIGHLSPPVIKLEPLEVKGVGTCDEVQSMEVR